MLIFHSHLLYRNILLLCWFTFCNPTIAGQQHGLITCVEDWICCSERSDASFCLFSSQFALEVPCMYTLFYSTLVILCCFISFLLLAFLCFGVLCNFASTRSCKEKWLLAYQCFFAFAVLGLLTCYHLQTSAVGLSSSLYSFYYTDLLSLFCSIAVLVYTGCTRLASKTVWYRGLGNTFQSASNSFYFFRSF